MMYGRSRQTVTGLVVNKRVNVPCGLSSREFERWFITLLMTGKFSRLGVVKGDGQRLLERRHGRLSELQGMLGFIDYIDEKDKQSRQARASV